MKRALAVSGVVLLLFIAWRVRPRRARAERARLDAPDPGGEIGQRHETERRAPKW